MQDLSEQKNKARFGFFVRLKDCKLRQQFLLLFAALSDSDHKRSA
jgi:hypothetical protein